MNSTDFDSPDAEKEKILSISTRIFEVGACSEIMSRQTSQADSYYCDRAELRFFDSEICDYDFTTPAALRNMLEKMWDYQQCGYMKEFAVVATISAFRHKAEECIETRIPAFIYQF